MPRDGCLNYVEENDEVRGDVSIFADGWGRFLSRDLRGYGCAWLWAVFAVRGFGRVFAVRGCGRAFALMMSFLACCLHNRSLRAHVISPSSLPYSLLALRSSSLGSVVRVTLLVISPVSVSRCARLCTRCQLYLANLPVPSL